MKTPRMYLIAASVFVIQVAWSLHASAQFAPEYANRVAWEHSVSCGSPHGCGDPPPPSEKYQYALEVIRLGLLDLQYAFQSYPEEDYPSGTMAGGYVGIGFKDVWNGIGCSADFGIQNGPYRWKRDDDYKSQSYWFGVSGVFRLIPKVHSLYLKSSYRYQVMRLYPNRNSESRTLHILHKLSVGPSLQFDKDYLAVHISSGLIMNVGADQGQDFAVSILDATLVLQPIWF